MSDDQENKLLPIGFTGWKKKLEIWKSVMDTIGLLFLAYDRKRIFPEGVHILLTIAITSFYVPIWIKTVAVTYKTDLNVAILALNYAMYGILALLISVLFFQNKEGMFEMYRILKAPFFQYETHNDDIPKKPYQLIFTLASEYILIPFPIVGVIVIFLVPLMIPSEIYSDGWTKDGVNRRVQLITWYPFTCDEGIAYLLTYLSQLYFGVFVTSVFASGEITQIQMAKVLLHEMETLADSIRKLDGRVKIHFFKEIGADRANLTKTDLYKHPIFQESARFCITENIKHHHKIMDMFGLYCRLFRLTSFYAYLVGTIVIAICLTTLNIKKNQNHGYFLDEGTAILVFFLVEELLFMFYISWIGELIITAGFEVNDEIQFIRLDKYDKSFRKYVLTFLVGTTREMITKSGGYFDCKMEAFSSVINGSYSFFNFANAS